jgi:outer membrane receptor protein involved in Fe transport
MPNLNQMFCGTNYNLSGDYSIVGNPDLDAIRTTSYEAGVRHRLGELSTLSLSAFYKQITGLVQTTPGIDGSQFFFMYENDDSYATVQGAELTLMRLPGRLLSGSISYTYSLATGRYSSATEQYDYSSQGYSVISAEENYLDWDQRHSASAHLAISTDRGEGPLLGGFHPLEGCALTIDWSYGSGFPFSPPSNDSLPEINTERYPWTMQTDMSAARRIWTGGLEIEAKLTIYNLFNRKDVVRIFDPGIYMDLGDPGGSMSNPAAYSPARHVLFGVNLRW